MREEIQKFLKDYNLFVDYNFINYTLSTKDNDVINITNTEEEMANFIIGYLTATREQETVIQQLNKINNENVHKYEDIIKEMECNQMKNQTN
jgi:mevalonate kinase